MTKGLTHAHGLALAEWRETIVGHSHDQAVYLALCRIESRLAAHGIGVEYALDCEPIYTGITDESPSYGLNGQHNVIRHDEDHYTVRLSVLADVPVLGTTLDYDVYARVSHDSGALDIFAVICPDMYISEPPDGLVAWAATREVEAVCEALRVEDLDSQDPS